MKAGRVKEVNYKKIQTVKIMKFHACVNIYLIKETINTNKELFGLVHDCLQQSIHSLPN